MPPAISIENLSKKYILRHTSQERYVALRDVIARSARGLGHRLRQYAGGNWRGTKRDPNIEDFWALKDINLKIEQGERVGIIGRNGAGKSTLLKILSRITTPTTGKVAIRGRLASLLEVGTGFHPELTGRENIFLNGSLLGMSKREMRSKFEEIVHFADVEKFLDTPVKRYSSGMYVRLAFAVAAHLEPEILVVDEVLAVGDAAFQRKCLGKMEDISKQGRTLLFVSHNMATITSLCRKTVLLEAGKVKQVGPTSEVVMSYYTNGLSSPAYIDYTLSGKCPGDRHAQLLSGAVYNTHNEPTIEVAITETVTIEMRFNITEAAGFKFEPNFHFFTADGVCAFFSVDTVRQTYTNGIYVARCRVPANYLNEGSYFVGLALTSFEKGVHVHFYEKSALCFNVFDPIEGVPTRSGWVGPIPGVVRPLLHWSTEKLA